MNQVTLLGRSGADAELKETANGGKICKFSIATSEGKDDNKKTSWHRVVLFNDTATRYAPLIQKGSEVFVQGRISYNEYTDVNGVKKTSCDIVAQWVRVCTVSSTTSTPNTTHVNGSFDRYKQSSSLPAPTQMTMKDSYDDIPF